MKYSMVESKLESYCNDHTLKSFYLIACRQIDNSTPPATLETLERLSTFIRVFQSKCVNYYQLSKIPPLHNGIFKTRLEEFYHQLSEQVITKGLNKSVVWIVDQLIDDTTRLFPDRPSPDFYRDIMRSLAVLEAFVRTIDQIDHTAYKRLFQHAKNILSPELDDSFETQAKDLLDKLTGFNELKKGSDSDDFKLINSEIQKINSGIHSQLMSNNTLVSLIQKITEINKTLKTVKKTDFTSLFQSEPQQLNTFWNGLKEHGYEGGENSLHGDFEKNRKSIITWLESHFSINKDRILEHLSRVHQSEQLCDIVQPDIPDAIHLYAINLIGEIGLKEDQAIKLILGFHSKFVERMVRESAHTALKKNAAAVQGYFIKALGKSFDYEQKLLIADKHDTIFEQINPGILATAFGKDFEEPLLRLEKMTLPDGIYLGNFIRSAYLKPPEEKKNGESSQQSIHLLNHFHSTTDKLEQFKSFIETKFSGSFVNLIRMWGLNYVVSWALTDYRAETRLFSFIVKASDNQKSTALSSHGKVIPLQNIINLLSQEEDAKGLIQKLLTFLLNSKISFDYRLFSSLFQVIAQRQQQLQGGITIRDGFSEQRGYGLADSPSNNNSEIAFQDPHIYHPIVIFLITILHMKFINIPKDAFVETDISFYLNSLAERQKTPELGYQMYLAHQLISSIPYIKDFSSHHETVIRKTIADLDESYKRKNVLFHYHRIKIHRAPSKLDLDFCLEILEGLSAKPLSTVLSNLIRLMKGIGDEAIPDLEDYFEHYQGKLITLGNHLKILKNLYPKSAWQDIAEDSGFSKVVRDIPGIDPDSIRDIIALIKLVNALSNYWTQRMNDSFLGTLFSDAEKDRFIQSPINKQLLMVKDKRQEYQARFSRFDRYLEPYQHIFLKRHVIQGDWNFDFFGFWPYYRETKFEAYNADRKLAVLERTILEQWSAEFSCGNLCFDTISEEILQTVRDRIECLREIMIHLRDDGLSPSRFFLDTIEIFNHDQLTISQLHDILGILSYRELSHIDSFVANTFEHYPSRIVEALGRENLDFGLDQLQAPDDELFYTLVQETVLGNIIAESSPIHLLERFVSQFIELTSQLKQIDSSRPIYNDRFLRPDRLTPVNFGYKSYALQTLAKDGFNVPDLETIPVSFFLQNIIPLNHQRFKALQKEIVLRILSLERKTEKLFDLTIENLTPDLQELVSRNRAEYTFDLNEAPKLLVSARSGSYRSMPGILGTVLNIGLRDITEHPEDGSDYRLKLNTYRMFLSTFGNVVYGINEVEFSKIIEAKKAELENGSNGKIKWEDLSDIQIAEIICKFKELIDSRDQLSINDLSIPINWDDPLTMLTIAIIGVWNSWDSSAAKNLRRFLDISEDWHTPVTLMDMKQADKNPQSFSAILFSGDPQGKVNKPHGDLLFGRPGEDIASGLASEGMPLEKVETDNPKLHEQIVNLLEDIKINKGHINVDVEMVGEYSPEEDKMELFVIQERQMPLGTRSESEDYRLTPTDKEPLVTGKGVNGGVQHGVLLNGAHIEFNELKETVTYVRENLGPKDEFHGPGIFLLMEYVTPEEALKMNIDGVDGVITTKIGKSSHASISAKRDGKLFVCESSIRYHKGEWKVDGQPIRLGSHETPEVFTIVGNPKSVSPYSGNVYRGRLPLTRVTKKRRR